MRLIALDRRRARLTMALDCSGSEAWYTAGLASLLAVSGALAFTGLDREGLGYPNYAATVRSMGRSWHNFWYASFDPAGLVAVDKPPLGMWIQALFARLLGFGGWALLAPQALATVASVMLLAVLVRRSHGPAAGLLAGLFLAVCPISVAVGRTSLLDSQLVLALLLSAWASLNLLERGGWHWAAGVGALLGIAIMIKGTQALLVLPALLLPLLFTPALPPLRRLVLVALIGVLAVAVALPWIVAIDHTPVAHRPYVGGSTANSEWDLLVQFNGADRLAGTANSAPTVGPPARWTGSPGPLRYFDRQLGDQISWLLPLACAGLLVGRGRIPGTRDAWWLWAGWAVIPGLVFSVIPAYLPYYVATQAPGLAALEGIGLAVLWQRVRQGTTQAWQLVLALAGTALVQLFLLSRFSAWNGWLRPCVAALVLAGCGLILWSWHLAMHRATRVVDLGAVLALAGLLLTSLAWAIAPVLQGLVYRDMPYAGPLPKSAVSTHHAATVGDVDLLRFLLARQGAARFLLATPDAYGASPFILATGRPVLPLGGYTGREPVLSLEQLGRWIGAGTVRYFLVPPQPPTGTRLEETQASPLGLWQAVVTACTPVPPATWLTAASATGSSAQPDQQTGLYPGDGWDMLEGLTLYDCAPNGD